MLKRKKNRMPGVVVPYHICPAKTYRDPTTGKVVPGRSTLDHCQIVGEVARELIRSYPESIRGILFPDGAELVAAAHDIGKVSPCFVEKIRRNCDLHPDELTVLPRVNPVLERDWGGHAGVSHITAQKLEAPVHVPEILGQHHGYAPPVAGRIASDEIFGGPEWQQEREKLLAAIQTKLGVTQWPTIRSMAIARLLAGLTTVADWIGSGEYFENPKEPWRRYIAPAVTGAGFISPHYRPSLEFSDIFGFAPRSLQKRFFEQVTSPGVYLLEAPMGSGKTEAALYAAYRMLESGIATGIYFALPTRLTSDKIYDRFNAFLATIIAEGSCHRPLLLHGDAWLTKTDMGQEGAPGGDWFNHAKRGLLAPFAVGTIDQALMAAMNIKHGFVRAFGLAGKVVILDEVHTYDAYTGTILDSLVTLLRELQCVVIILSATLNHDRRQQLIAEPLAGDGYPLITAVPANGLVSEITEPSLETHRIGITLVADERLAVREALKRAARGEQVLWIENTVDEAQKRYLDMAALAAEQNVECGLLHSRFTPDDRHTIEDKWVALFGVDCWSRRSAKGRLLVGTQVLEQSLDIDADFLISRFAPTDMLLQRLGRLWRHLGTPRPAASKCEAYIVAPKLELGIESPEQAFGKSTHVYAPYVLCRSLEVWSDITQIRLPRDIRSLIEQTYVERKEVDLMARWLRDLETGSRQRMGRQALRQFARITLADVGNTMPENKAQTRYSQTESVDLLLLSNMQLDSVQKQTSIIFLDGSRQTLPWQRGRLNRKQWRRLAAELARQVVSVPAGKAPKQLPIDTLKKYGLHHCFYLGAPSHNESVLRVAFVGDDGYLRGIYGSILNDNSSLMYTADQGYKTIRK